MIKYPWNSDVAKAKGLKKFNVFSTEQDLFDKMMRQMNLCGTDGSYLRHPMSFLTEAADDICYRILDLEDAVEIGLLDPKRVSSLYIRAIEAHDDSDNLPVLRGKAIRSLIDGMWSVFEEDYDNIMAGKRGSDLKTGLSKNLGSVVVDIKKLYEEIFAERSKVAAELGAYKALGRIVNACCMAINGLCKEHDFEKSSFLTQRCMQLAWDREYAIRHQEQPYEWWLHQVIDYVSSLTDNYARQLSREIEGT
jgi:dGTPase